MTFSLEKKHLSWVETLQKTKFGQKKNLKDTYMKHNLASQYLELTRSIWTFQIVSTLTFSSDLRLTSSVKTVPNYNANE